MRGIVEVDHLIVGGGIIGCAIGAQLLSKLRQKGLHNRSVLLIERAPFLGDGSTSRNSEVIHAGIYYPKGSLKERFCIDGKNMLYKLCDDHSIPYKRTGKWIVATSVLEIDYLHNLKEKMASLNVPGEFIRKETAQQLEPRVNASLVLHSPSTGIINSHSLLSYFEGKFTSLDGLLMLKHELKGLEASNSRDGFNYVSRCNDSKGNQIDIKSRTVINCAGLHADEVANYLLPSMYRIYPVKGYYYKFAGKGFVNRLVYPVPEKNLAGLGIHCTVDLSGKLRFGPNVEYGFDEEAETSIINEKYNFKMEDDAKESRKNAFVNAISKYLILKEADKEKIVEDYVGIRAKLSSRKNPGVKDFVIKDEKEHGYPGMINLIGIESPGLTASPAIAKYVVETMLQDYY
jgi:L-2-hydroxyglutarate oxidase LhgO